MTNGAVDALGMVLEELADIMEVIYSILHNRGITAEELETIRLRKKEERGGFSKGIKLLEVFCSEGTYC